MALAGQISAQVEQPPGHLSAWNSISPSKIFSTVIASVGQFFAHHLQVQQLSWMMVTFPSTLSEMISRSTVMHSSGHASTHTLQASHLVSSQITSPSTLPVSDVNFLCFTTIAGQRAPQRPQREHFSLSTVNFVFVLIAVWRSFAPATGPLYVPSYAGTLRSIASRGQISSQIVHRMHFSSSISAFMSYCGNPSFSRMGSFS